MRLTVLGERNVLLKLYNTECSRYIYFFTFQRQIFVNLIIRSGVEAESWLIATKHVRIMNFCFKKLGNYESLYFGSGIMSNGTLRKAQQNTRMNYRNCVRCSECWIWRFRGSNFKNILGWGCPRTPCITHAFRADSLLVSTVIWCLVQLQKKTPYLDKTNDDTESGWNSSLNTKETLQNDTKLPLRKSLSQYRWWKVFVNHESSRKFL